MDIQMPLQDEITKEIEKLSEMGVGTDEYHKTVSGLNVLLSRYVDLKKADNEACHQLKLERQSKSDYDLKKEEIELKKRQLDLDERIHDCENNAKEKQAAEELKDRLIKNCLTAASIVLPCLITVWGTVKSFEFEKTGTITTMMGRGFINKLLPKK